MSALLAVLSKMFCRNCVHGQRPDKHILMGYDPFVTKKERWKEKLKEEKKLSNCRISFQIFFP